MNGSSFYFNPFIKYIFEPSLQKNIRTKVKFQAVSANIKKINQFIMVGALEYLEESLLVLECKIPNYFKVSPRPRALLELNNYLVLFRAW